MSQKMPHIYRLAQLEAEQEENDSFIDERGEFNAILAEEALHGLAGTIVRAIEPHTEADNAALLVNFLVAVGNLIGDEPHFMAESKPHRMRLFAALVGATGKGRKGSSWGHIQMLLKAVEPDWVNGHIKSGLSSGEGLIYAVRDKVEKMEAQYEGKGKDKRIASYEPVIVDEGVKDKRLLVLEEELASTLKVLMREGNTLSAQVRQAWDSGDIRTLTKNPLIATKAHISILAHITQEELIRYLSNTEMANGFANRFLWVYVKRSKELPDGGQFHKTNVEPLVKKIKEVVEFSRSVGEMERDEEARRIWHGVYGTLSNGTGGIIGMATNRAEAQVMRMSSLYALLDCSQVVKVEHLKASLALWDYCYKSARYIFGNQSIKYDKNGNRILEALQDAPEGLTRTQVNRLFGSNLKTNQLDHIVNGLISNGYVQVIKEKNPGSKRPVQRIVLI